MGSPPTAPERGRAGPTTRFAPAPTGRLHLGHLANAIFVWGMARAAGGRVHLRIEDHDRQRCRPEFERHLLDDLDRLGLAADVPSTDELRAGRSEYRQSDCGDAYGSALDGLRRLVPVYACDCSRSTFARWAEAHDGRPWSGPGCPGECARRGLPAGPATGTRVAIGSGEEAWDDGLLGPRSGGVVPDGDPLVRDRNGNWTYGFCVVVDDLRHGIDLVVRGEDLVSTTPGQIRLARILGRGSPAAFTHHPLIRHPDGSKLSKADGATAVGELIDHGVTPAQLFGRAARLVGLVDDDRPIEPDALGALFGA